jgi:anti-anti-sigma factor
MPDSTQLSIESTLEGEAAKVRLSGELDLDGAGAIGDAIAQITNGPVRSVVIDAGGLSFLDSSGLRALLTAREKVLATGASFQLTETSGAVDRVLDMTGTRSLLTEG